VGRLKFEALREEVHCFDGNNHTLIAMISKRLCCTAAMQEMHIGKYGVPAGLCPVGKAETQNARTGRALHPNSRLA
jgi:hypothetical protein